MLFPFSLTDFLPIFLAQGGLTRSQGDQPHTAPPQPQLRILSIQIHYWGKGILMTYWLKNYECETEFLFVVFWNIYFIYSLLPHLTARTKVIFEWFLLWFFFTHVCPNDINAFNKSLSFPYTIKLTQKLRHG